MAASTSSRRTSASSRSPRACSPSVSGAARRAAWAAISARRLSTSAMLVAGPTSSFGGAATTSCWACSLRHSSRRARAPTSSHCTPSHCRASHLRQRDINQSSTRREAVPFVTDSSIPSGNRSHRPGATRHSSTCCLHVVSESAYADATPTSCERYRPAPKRLPCTPSSTRPVLSTSSPGASRPSCRIPRKASRFGAPWKASVGARRRSVGSSVAAAMRAVLLASSR